MVSFVILSLWSFSQENQLVNSNDTLSTDLFDSHDIMEITLIADYKELFEEIKKDSDTVYHRATAIYRKTDGSLDTVKCKVKPRGNFRRNPEHCAFPPLFVKFSKKRSEGTPFADLKKLKLVTHCSNSQKIFDQYVLREYLVYRTYNLITDSSFRVRLARVTYIDEHGEMDQITRFGFFIENDNQMAERIGGEIIKVKNIYQDRLNYDLTGKMVMFEYFVGNPDWSVPLLHNFKIVQSSPFELPVAVPYDFDYCGVVNAKYASPAEELNIGSVTERIFRGFCREKEEFEDIFVFFENRKEDIYNLYYNLEPLNEKSLKWSINYYTKFYEIIDDPKMVKQQFLKACWKNRE